jgi:hypothetical protein
VLISPDVFATSVTTDTLFFGMQIIWMHIFKLSKWSEDIFAPVELFLLGQNEILAYSPTLSLIKVVRLAIKVKNWL